MAEELESQAGDRRVLWWVAATLLLAGVVTVLLWLRPGGGTETRKLVRVTIATGTEGGSYRPVGRDLARVLERLPGSPVGYADVCATAGSGENLAMLRRPRSKPSSSARPDAVRVPTDTDSADLAFVNGVILQREHHLDPSALDQVRALAAFPLDVVHVVTRDPNITRLAHLAGRKVCCGPEGSATRRIALSLLEWVGSAGHACVPAETFAESATALVSGRAEAAFFVSGTPTPAVADLMGQGGFRILDLEEERGELVGRRGPGLVRASIPARLYENHDRAVKSVAATTVLCCRRDLSDDVVRATLESICAEIRQFLLTHATAQQMRLEKALSLVPEETVALHPAARKFWRRERGRLRILTGSLSGRYYRYGKVLERALRRRGIPSRTVHTHGSLENAEQLKEDAPAIAFMQLDVALAAYWDSKPMVYGDTCSPEPPVPPVRGIRRLAVLYEEKVHVIGRRDAFKDDVRPTVRHLEGTRVALGPEFSGSRVVGEAILDLSGVDVASRRFLSAPDMADALLEDGGPIDVAFFVSGVPSEALRTVLSDCRLRLIPIPLRDQQSLVGSAFRSGVIDAANYECHEDDPSQVPTLTTRAILATTEDLPVDLKSVTAAIVDASRMIGVEQLADLPGSPLSLPPLHADAELAYKEMGVLPPDPKEPDLPWLKPLWTVLASTVILIAGYKGIHKLRRDTTANRFGREALGIPIDAHTLDSVQRLEALQAEIRARVQRRWWRPGDLNRRRWAGLDALIESRKDLARANLTRGLVAEARMLGRLRDGAKLRELGDRAWHLLAKGELDAAQHDLVLKAVKDAGAQPPQVVA